MMYSVMLANSSDRNYAAMTQRAIDGYLMTTDGHLCVVETNPNVKWESSDRITAIHPNEPFNYNKFLNIGFKAATKEYDYYGIFNNDIIFGKDWLQEAFKHEWNSFSPCSDGWFKHDDMPNGATYGWETGRFVCGWAIVLDKDAFRSLYPFDERFEFWCQDDDMALTLKDAGFKHAFIKESKIKHLVSKSHGLLENRERMTSGMINILKEKWQ